jgi:transcriptional regulator with XRE-family HTH domain
VQCNDSERRAQLSEFLRSKRTQLSPSDVGLVKGPRRRTPGLRREEVADLAGVGHVWYTWLEQARGITPSFELLDRLASALKLTGDERTYLHRLARPHSDSPSSDSPEIVDKSIIDMIGSLEFRPAYVRNLRWDLLASNHAHKSIFGDFSGVPAEQRNMLWLIFTDQRIKKSLANWDTVASHVVARFRADLSKIPDDSRASALKNRLLEASSEFSRIWRQFRIKEALNHSVQIIEPKLGVITLDRVTLLTESSSAQSVIVYMPKDKVSETRLTKTCARLRRESVCSLRMGSEK